MKDLTKNQFEFILNFFLNEKYPGWKNIAEKLIKKGKCIVAGKDRIWMGGIGNFIETNDTDEAVGCMLYSFDVANFLESEMYKEKALANLQKKKEDLEALLQEYNELNELTPLNNDFPLLSLETND